MQCPTYIGTLQRPWQLNKCSCVLGLCRSPSIQVLHKASRCFAKSPMYISLQGPLYRGFMKPPLYRGFAKPLIYRYIVKPLCTIGGKYEFIFMQIWTFHAIPSRRNFSTLNPLHLGVWQLAKISSVQIATFHAIPSNKSLSELVTAPHSKGWVLWQRPFLWTSRHVTQFPTK